MLPSNCVTEKQRSLELPKRLMEAKSHGWMKTQLSPIIWGRWCLTELKEWEAGIKSLIVPVHLCVVPRLPLNQNEAHNVHGQAEKDVENHREQQRWGDQPSRGSERHQLGVGTIQIHCKINSSFICMRAGKCYILQKNGVTSWVHTSEEIDKLKYIINWVNNTINGFKLKSYEKFLRQQT